MKVYELMVILTGALDEDGYKAGLEQVEKLIKTKKGTVIALDEWGKRKLSYQINKQDFGYYLVFRFTSEESQTPKQIQDTLKIQDNVLRAMITLAPKKRPGTTEKKSDQKETVEA